MNGGKHVTAQGQGYGIYGEVGWNLSSKTQTVRKGTKSWEGTDGASKLNSGEKTQTSRCAVIRLMINTSHIHPSTVSYLASVNPNHRQLCYLCLPWNHTTFIGFPRISLGSRGHFWWRETDKVYGSSDNTEKTIFKSWNIVKFWFIWCDWAVISEECRKIHI